jgi:protein-L-isoaspartate(D-aspartate) O-methyltransferase
MLNKDFALFVCIFSLTFCSSGSCQNEDRQRERDQMVRTQIMSRGITHKPTLRSMRKVPRHEYVPEQFRWAAYDDRPLPIGYSQTISQPFIVALFTQSIKPEAHHKVLEIGTGSGYQAAVLAEIVEKVYTIEIIPELARSAQKLLSQHYSNAFVKEGDGYHGWPEHAPFDAIVVTAAPPEIPQPLIDQLKDGGIMIIPVGPAHSIQQLMLVEKKNGEIITREMVPVRFVPFLKKDQ